MIRVHTPRPFCKNFAIKSDELRWSISVWMLFLKFMVWDTGSDLRRHQRDLQTRFQFPLLGFWYIVTARDALTAECSYRNCKSYSCLQMWQGPIWWHWGPSWIQKVVRTSTSYAYICCTMMLLYQGSVLLAKNIGGTLSVLFLHENVESWVKCNYVLTRSIIATNLEIPDRTR
jgi:hypothetical protein